jgi:hypothetical protein
MLYLTIAGAVQVLGILPRISFSAGGQERSPKTATAGIAGTLCEIVTKKAMA